MSRKGEMIVIWPAYLDSQKTRAQGRMIPKTIAVESPTAEEIYEVSTGLHYQPTLEGAKKMPSRTWERPGRVLVIKKDKKLKILKEIALAVQKKRGAAKKQATG